MSNLSPGPFRWTADDWQEIYETGVLVDANGAPVGVQAMPLGQFADADVIARYAANRRLVEASARMHDLLVQACAAEASDNAQMMVDFFVGATKLLVDIAADSAQVAADLRKRAGR